MNSSKEQHSDPSENDRLEDALLREHARVGHGADEAFLARLETALDQAVQNEKAIPASRPIRRRTWSVGIAAAATLAAGLSWYATRTQNPPPPVA
ncbi:MAG TPA: hypothetical protein VFY13_05290, partial [Luteolibacter sp.]|nr:hypothetical protein [Luteolibacter sp.]